MKLQQKQAFTLVELIIVITILAILATIGFMSYQSYTTDARDGKRITDLGEIRNGLEIYQTKNSVLPSPDEQITTIVNGGSTLAYQGYAGKNVLNKLRSSEIKDPKENIAYTYSTNGDYTKYQLLGLLENGTSVNLSLNPVNITYAANNYNDRKTYVVGNKLGVFLDTTTNAPIQETLSGSINLGGTYSGTTFKVVFSNTSTNSGVITGTGVSLYNNVLTIANTVPTVSTAKVGEQTNPGLSCLDILNKGGSVGSGTYWIKPDTNPAFQVYCDMTTDGGGWTRTLKQYRNGTASAANTINIWENLSQTSGMPTLSSFQSAVYTNSATKEHMILWDTDFQSFNRGVNIAPSSNTYLNLIRYTSGYNIYDWSSSQSTTHTCAYVSYYGGSCGTVATIGFIKSTGGRLWWSVHSLYYGWTSGTIVSFFYR